MDFRRVLVTGVAGFVGSHLAKTLVQQGFQVIGLDNLSRGRLETVQALQHENNFTFVKGDILDTTLLEELLRETRLVFHEAALIDVQESLANPALYYRVNVQGLQNILEAMRKADTPRLVSASSCAVYGHPDTTPITEEATLQPLSPYAETKIQGERLCYQYSQQYAISTLVLRYFNIYGPRQQGPYQNVITHFLEQAQKGEPVVIYGDGQQTRDFVHISDIVQANLLATHSQLVHHIFNIGTGTGTSVNRLATLVLELFNQPLHHIAYQATREGEIRYSEADITKAQRFLGYSPTYDLQRGLQTLI